MSYAIIYVQCLACYKFICLFHKMAIEYLYTPDTVLDVRDLGMNKTNMPPTLKVGKAAD